MDFLPNGRFAPGNQLAKGRAPGRPSRPVEERLFEQFKKGIKVDDIDAVTAAMLGRAKEGDVKAARLIFEYLFGQPRQVADMNLVNWTPEAWLKSLETFENGGECDGGGK
jgi:hypothetical protein